MPIVDSTDAELVARWLTGDHDAFAAIYDRYAGAIHAYALARVRNRADAADVVHDTFLRAAQRLGQLREPDRLRPWLYAIARNHVIDAGRRRARTSPIGDIGDDSDIAGADPGRDVDQVASAGEVAELVWVAAEAMQPRDRELLELHLRHGLDGADLADVVGMSPSHLYTAMNRLKERLAKAVGSLLVARHGSKDCPELGALLAGWDGRFDLDVRSRVTRHVEGCEHCRERRAVLCAPANFSATVAILGVAAPEGVRTSVLRAVAAPADAGTGSDTDTGAWRADGFPRAAPPARRATPYLAVAAAIVLVLVGAAVGVGLARDGGADTLAIGASGERTATTAPGVTSTITPATTPDTASADTSGTIPASATAVASTLEPGGAATVAPSSVPGTAAMGTQPGGPAIAPTPTAPRGTAAAEPPLPTTTVAAATTSSTSTSTTSSTTTVPAAPPGHVTVLTTNLGLGATTPSGTVTIRNDGGSPIAWSATTAQAGFSVSPASGTLAAGAERALTVAVDRPSLAEGGHTAVVTVTSVGGGGNTTVTAMVERAPVIAAFVRTPPVVRTSTTCGVTLVSVSVTASDESGISKAEIVWSSDGTFATRTTLTPNGTNTVFTGQVGSFSAGTRTLTAVVTDTRGNSSQQATTVTVIAC